MKYRDARLLQSGHEVIRKVDQMIITVTSIEAFGQYKKVKIAGTDSNGVKAYLFNEEVDAKG
ncbi:MAG TPA: hypothetical protein VII94_05510 [Candidatus Saccharimonadales bacterium]